MFGMGLFWSKKAKTYSLYTLDVSYSSLIYGGKKKMTTPDKNQIITKAFENNHKRNCDISTINPTISELRESGDLEIAKNQLMRGETTEYLNELERLVNSLGYTLTKDKDAKENDLAMFPIDTILKECAFCVGGRGSGKSNVLQLLVERLLACKTLVKVIDASLVWKNYPYLQRIKVRRQKTKGSVETGLKWNAVYDVSRLSVLEMRDFTQKMMKEDLDQAILLTDSGNRPKCAYVIEECQNVILPNSLRALKYQAISRFVTQGRNFGMSYILSTQRLASTDTSLIEISGLRYFLKLEGENSIRKVRSWLTKFQAWRLRDLSVGEGYVQFGSKTKLMRFPLFQRMKVKVLA